MPLAVYLALLGTPSSADASISFSSRVYVPVLCVCVCGSRSRSKQNIDRRSLAIAIAFMRAFARLPFLLLLLLLRAGKDTTLSVQSTTINCLVLFSDGVSLLLVLKANNNRSSRMCVCFYCWKSNSSIVIVFLPHFKVVLIRALPSFPPSLPTTYVHPQQYRIYDRVDICWPELSSFSPPSPSSPFSSFSTLLYTQAKAKEGRNTTHGPIIDRPRSLPSRSFPRLFFVCVRDWSQSQSSQCSFSLPSRGGSHYLLPPPSSPLPNGPHAINNLKSRPISYRLYNSFLYTYL